MDPITVLGFLAGSFTTIVFWPQLMKTWKSKWAKDASSGMLVTCCMGVFLWLVYGTLIHSLPVILANLITFILAMAISILRIRDGA